MAQGIKITLTRQIEWRQPRRNDRRFRIWAGTHWCWLDSRPYDPESTDEVNKKPSIISSTIEFPPVRVRRQNARVNRNRLLKKLRMAGVHLLGRTDRNEIQGDPIDEITARVLDDLSWQCGEKIISRGYKPGYIDEEGRFVEIKA